MHWIQFLKKLSKLLYSGPTHLLNILSGYYFLIVMTSFSSGATSYMLTLTVFSPPMTYPTFCKKLAKKQWESHFV